MTYFSVFRQLVQLSAGGMQASGFLGKNASIGNSIWRKSSQGFSAEAPPPAGHSLVGTQSSKTGTSSCASRSSRVIENWPIVTQSRLHSPFTTSSPSKQSRMACGSSGASMYTALDTLNAQLAEKMKTGGFTDEEIANSKLSMHDIIIVASLVEKETAKTSESATIASVIYNRLCSKLYPCLQIDATIQYVLDERKEVLTNADKSILSPYNTYTNAGLPAGPIANPGINSIRAALYPAETNYYFYALGNDGVHHFSETYYEHQAFLDTLQSGTDNTADDGTTTDTGTTADTQNGQDTNDGQTNTGG